MNPRQGAALDLERLVEHMFDQVLDESERAELLVWINRWEAANPNADAAHRVTGWIDVAYDFQARAARQVVGSQWSMGLTWGSDSVASSAFA